MSEQDKIQLFENQKFVLHGIQRKKYGIFLLPMSLLF